MKILNENEIQNIVNDAIKRAYVIIDKQFNESTISFNEKWDKELECRYVSLLNTLRC